MLRLFTTSPPGAHPLPGDPKEHIGSVAEVNGGNSAVVAHIFEVIARLCREQGLESYRVVSNIGEQAGQSVHHLHFHVPPAWDKIGLRP